MKKKNIILSLFFIFGLSLTFGAQKASADSCTDFNSNFKCTDITTLTLTTGCVANKCLGADASNLNVKCCPIDAPVKGNGTVVQSSNNASVDVSGGTNFTKVEDFLGGIMSAIQRIIVVLALVSITIGSVMILASAGSSGMVERGKAAITMALVGLAIGLAAPSLLKELANIVGWGTAVPAALSLSEIAVRVLNFLLGTMGIVALVMMVIGAIMYLTSAGDEDRINQGKDIFKYAIIGLILAMSAMVLVTQIARFFATTSVPTATTSAIDPAGL